MKIHEKKCGQKDKSSETRLQTLEVKVESLESKVDTLVTKLASLSGEVKKLSTLRSEVKKLSSLKSDVKTMNTNMKKLIESVNMLTVSTNSHFCNMYKNNPKLRKGD